MPLVFYLGTRPDIALKEDERNALIYWLLVTLMQRRYSRSGTTVIAQDVAALRSADPLPALYRNLGLLGHRPTITPASLAGKGSTSAYFSLSYLVARKREATDWWYGAPVKLSHDGSYRVEYHHIHPRARLTDRYGKAEVNDLANLAFISDKANRKISARSPERYFSELDEQQLVAHCVPTDGGLRTVDAFPAFVAARRALLAEAMTELLESYWPSFLDEASAEALAEATTALSVQAYGSTADAGTITLVAEAVAGGTRLAHVISYRALREALDDLADGRARR
ncbi:MAG: hypothetical protein GEV08_09935 [Acidimicrobiia bacterium]|nr:hypothetical protein [Acidimicrobiia bacterium]